MRSNQTELQAQACFIQNYLKAIEICANQQGLIAPYKGGDPAAPSGTATLLRLSPPHEAHLRKLLPLRVGSPPSGALHSADLTGGVYKARERIHRAMMLRDY